MPTLKLSGHQSFSFRNSWLSKGVIFLQEYPDLFFRDDAMVILGVGKNMVSSIRHWCSVCQLIKTEKRSGKYHDTITPIAELLFLNGEQTAWDPYLEDVGTLWLIHFLYVTNVDSYTSAFHVFNHITAPQFTKNELTFLLHSFLSKSGSKISPETINRDITTFIHTYVSNVAFENHPDFEDSLDCPLQELHLVSRNPGEEIYFFDRSPKITLPDQIFHFAVLQFLKNYSQATIAVEDLFYLPMSPGRIFRLDESSLMERLEKLEYVSEGRLVLSETAGVRQVFINEREDPLNVLDKYYTQVIEAPKNAFK